MEINDYKKDKIIFFDKKSTDGPLNSQSKMLLHMANIDPDNPGKRIDYFRLILINIEYGYLKL